jgi:hypothetical protein
MKFTLRFLVFPCVVALCLTTGCRDSSSQAPEKTRLNVFDLKRSTGPKQDVQRQETERERRILQGLQRAGDPEAKKIGFFQALWHSTLLLAVTAVVIAGLVYWHTWRKKRAEWEVNDPMALVKELVFVHQLSEPEKRLMQELTKKNALSSPLNLFVEPKYLLAAWDDDSLDSSRSSIHSLLLRLFDTATEIGEATVVLGSNSDTNIFSPEIQKEGE